jgi:outer membrane protein
MISRNRIMTIVLGACVMTLSMSGAAFAQLKIGYVRPQYIFSKYEPYKEAQKKIDDFQKTEIAKLDKQQQQLKQNADDYRQKQMLMSEEIQQSKQEELLKQQDALQKAYDELTRTDGTLDKKNEELVAPIIENINNVLMRLGKAEKYDYIFDANAGGVIYADEKYDLSDQVLEELNKGTTTKK